MLLASTVSFAPKGYKLSTSGESSGREIPSQSVSSDLADFSSSISSRKYLGSSVGRKLFSAQEIKQISSYSFQTIIIGNH